MTAGLGMLFERQMGEGHWKSRKDDELHMEDDYFISATSNLDHSPALAQPLPKWMLSGS